MSVVKAIVAKLDTQPDENKIGTAVEKKTCLKLRGIHQSIQTLARSDIDTFRACFDEELMIIWN